MTVDRLDITELKPAIAKRIEKNTDLSSFTTKLLSSHQNLTFHKLFTHYRRLSKSFPPMNLFQKMPHRNNPIPIQSE